MGNGATVTLRHRTTAGGRRRVFAHLSADLEGRYEAAVVVAASRVEPRLGQGVLAGRLLGGAPRSLTTERAAWEATVIGAVRPGSVVVRGDVRDCYASIGPDAVALAFAEAGASPGPVLSVLGACAAAGARGLPVGPWPSLVLANAVLARCDRVVRATGATVLRWVDDVVLVSPDRAGARRALDAWAAALATSGLQAHEGKTGIVDADGFLADLTTPSREGVSGVACYARREDPLPRRARPHPGSPPPG